MNILYYIEPWIQYSKPSWKKDYIWWFGDFSKKLLDASCDVTSHFILNESCATFHKAYDRCNSSYSIITQEALLTIFPNDKAALKAWQSKDYTDEQCDKMQHLIHKKMNGFMPDFIFTITPTPYLENLFPKATVIYRDAMYIREPFPDELTSFDPLGLYDNSAWVRGAKDILKTSLDKKEKAFLSEFRTIFLESISKENPLKDRMQGYRKKFKYLVLLPMQSPDYLNYYHFVDQDIFNFVYDIFLQVDKNIGVVVTQHPDDKVLNPDALSFLKTKFSNFIYMDTLEKEHAPSQFVLEYVDGLINISSGLGFYALMQQKPIFTPCYSQFSPLSENVALQDIATWFESKTFKNKKSFLYFFLTKYHFLYCYMHDPEWLLNRLTFLKKNKAALKENIMALPLIDEPETLIKNYRKYKRDIKKSEDKTQNCQAPNKMRLIDRLLSKKRILFKQK